MIRLGALLAFLGFGSALLHLTSIQFRLLIWAEPTQPWLGVGLGTLGVVVLMVKLAMNGRVSTPDGAGAEQQQPQQIGPPPGGYAPPPGVQRGAPQGPPPQFGQQPFPPGGQGHGPPRQGPPVLPPPGPEPVLGRPQFAPQPVNPQPGQPRPPSPPAGPPRFPPRQ